MDFTLNKYESLCQAVAKSKYVSMTLANYIQLRHKKRNSPIIIMRHDIDRAPKRALDVAEVEYKYNIHATYYFRVQKRVCITDIMDKVASYGHEIGFHYETIDKCKGNIEQAKELFKKELADFQNRYNILTVCAHGNPLTRNDNKDIWKSLKLEDFGLLGEAFLTLDYSKFAYFSDSGRTWLKNESQKMPGKDSVNTAFDQLLTKNTDDVIKIIIEGTLPNICILSHPERWSKDIVGFSGKYLLDLAYSWGKVAIYTYHRGIKS